MACPSITKIRGRRMQGHVVSLRGATKHYGRKCAVFEADLDLEEGRIYGLIGVNGAGKTTTLKMMLGLIKPTRGDISVFGHNPLTMPPEIKARIGYVPERHPLYNEMTVAKLAEFQRSFFLKSWDQRIFEQIAYGFGIGPDDRIREISNGQRAHVFLALVMAQQPELLIMDDPTLGLDPLARRQFLETLSQLMRQREKATAIFSSHIVDDIERIADHLFIMDGGHLKADCSIATFKRKVRRLSMKFVGTVPPFEGMADIRNVAKDGERTLLTALNCDDAFISRLATSGASDILDATCSLEDLFIDFTSDSYGRPVQPGGKS